MRGDQRLEVKIIQKLENPEKNSKNFFQKKISKKSKKNPLVPVGVTNWD